MNRFRKRSDVQRSQLPDIRVPPPHLLSEPLPTLPPASDFRTSLILPDLTRRFSVLRLSSGSPVALDDLRNKLAEQRARGSENQVTEEEADMILEALGRLHVRSTRARGSSTEEGELNGSFRADGTDESLDFPSRTSTVPSVATQKSGHSSTTPTSPELHSHASMSSMSSGKGSQLSRRMSNNLFGSGKLRDHTYLRSAQQPRRSGRGISSVAPSESTMSIGKSSSSRAGHNASVYSDSQSLRPGTPDGSVSTQSGSIPSSPNEKDSHGRSSSVDPQAESAIEAKALGKRLYRAMSPEVLQRASLALDEVIRELEEEGDDEIVMERSPITLVPISPLNLTTATSDSGQNSPMPSPGDHDAGTALSSDEQIVIDDEKQRFSPYPRSRTTSPTPRLPGYIPGMPRPMTPHDSSFDADDLTPSATPRATSPRLPGVTGQVSPLVTQSLVSAIHRSNSSSSTSRQTPRTTSPPVSTSSTAPLFFNRSPNGRFTSESRNATSSPPAEVPDSTAFGRRRPTSPLSGVVYQPLTRSASNSRPSTPSNVTWTIPTSPTNIASQTQSMNGHGTHGRDDSMTSTTEVRIGSGADALERSKSQTRSLRSPALPDSPLVDSAHADVNAFAVLSEYRPPSAMSGIDLDSSVAQSPNRAARSPTPTYNSRSPTSSRFPDHSHGHSSSISTNGDGTSNLSSSQRSSKQNQHSSAFSLGSTHALLLSPIANSSRSSLESAGSSYHSWDEDHRRDRLFSLFKNLEPQHHEWHDVSDEEKSSTSTPGTSPNEGPELEEFVRRQTGLTKSDFLTIQDKLVGAALAKAATPDPRNRAPSIRRRRPSTSQSNYSYNGQDNRANGSTPQPQSPSTPAPRPADHETVAKANALLDSVVYSIESPRSRAPAASPEQPIAFESTLDAEQSSPLRRHRALADALFGVEDKSQAPASVQPSVATAALATSKSQEQLITASQMSTPMDQPGLNLKRSQSMRGTPKPSGKVLVDNSELALDVQRRADAATLALRKSPTKRPERKISLRQISSPTLVSASTSVDTIPLPSVSPQLGHAQTSSKKIGSRIKMLRGTLRAKVPPTGDDVTPYPLTLGTPHSAQSEGFHNAIPSPRIEPALLSAPDTTAQFKVPPVPVHTPPNTAAPGLRGFMARFRKQRGPDVYLSPQRRTAPSSATSSAGSSPPFNQSFNQQSSSAPPFQAEFRNTSPAVTRVPPPQPPPQSPTPRPPQSSTPRPNTTESARSQAPSPSDQSALVQQLYDAASNLGIDQAALNDLLSRSPSATSRTTRWTNLTRMASLTDSHESGVAASETRTSTGTTSPRPSTENRQIPTIRHPVEQLQRSREQKSEQGQNAIVRRTIIFPSDSAASGIDLNSLVRKSSAARRRRSASAASVHSTRSIQDRVPTPPPHRTGRRFSRDVSPPVPQLPGSLSAQTDSTLIVSPTQMEKSNSTYESLYEMYAGERPTSTTHAESQGAAATLQPSKDGVAESGPALELIEMANGETIWSIVNGLRDDDGESFYGDRASFISEYSIKDSHPDSVKLFFKEHERKSSKGSTSSFLSRKKLKGPARPETKVFFSSSAQIGRLIENLSRGMDSGSFNITPDHPQSGHSASSSMGSEADMRWTVEERLEQMLGSIGSSSR